MSSNERTPSVQTGPSRVSDVGFANISGRHGESSSMAESRGAGKGSNKSDRSSRSGQRHEASMTPEDITQSHDGEGTVGSSFRHRARRSGGFLLDSAFANGETPSPESAGKRKAQDGQLRVDKKRTAQSRLSGDSSLRSSPLSREVPSNMANVDGTGEQQTARVQSMDTAQLVQMALNLSESRKRHVSNTLQVPLPAARRAVSGPISNYGTVRASSAARKRTSQLSDEASRTSPRSNASDRSDQISEVLSEDFGQNNVIYTFSPATLARAERARKYFELATEYRRLLQHLPPLKPDHTAPGNFVFNTTSSHGAAFPDIQRVPSAGNNKHALGRHYNPIQSLRNRRVRIREKKPFPAPPDTWHEVDEVKKWVDDVEGATQDPYYRATTNQARLPQFSGDDETDKTRLPQPTTRHRRTDTVGSVITRPENSWTIEPTELLADAYWTEKGSNKALIESRHGNPIFPPPPRRSMDTPKISVEMHRGKDSWDDGGNETEGLEEASKPSRRRRLMMPLVGGQSDRRKHRRLITRSASASSSSSTEGGRARSFTTTGDTGEENIGPLARHMQELIAKDENGELSSPEVVSPDHWDWKNVQYQHMSPNRAQRDSLAHSSGRASLDVPRDAHRRSKSADGRVGSLAPTVSLRDESGSEPASPTVSKYVPDFPAPSDSRRSLDGKRLQGPRLPTFRPSSKERNNIDQVDFAAASGTNLSPILSNDSGRPRSSVDSSRPSDFKRHKTDDSMSSNLQRLDTSSTFASSREHGSAVGRLLKGGRDRLGGLVRGDGPRFSDRFKNREKGESGGYSDRAVSDMSDAESHTPPNGYLKNRLTDSAGDESDISPRASFERGRAKPKYHLSNLPSFTSSARAKWTPGETSIPTRDHLVDDQQRSRPVTGKSERFNRLAPPPLVVPEDSKTAAPNVPWEPSVKFDTRTKSYGELAPAFPARRFGISNRQRHWSIYDQAQLTQAEKVTARDIARVQTLLLCSGIKAREIERRSNQPRENPPKEYKTAVETAGKNLGGVPIKEEHLFAARMLSTHLDSALANFESTLAHFQNETARGLATRLENLQHKATEQLSQLVHDTADEADAFTVELTTRQPQNTKQVDEAVDAMVRQRRRQFRLLRVAGFKLLEWLVLSLMWGIWFLVVVFNFGKRVVLVIPRLFVWLLRWLFVF
ncbi:hypothetical protein LTR37_020610 [Vermiconidia calcicola]|uniref:Uncharacterized protein n=1 Tax=Vermiconidia calcicola TaxID=1690605 RepID=A0ACC3MAR1_9PEZI|nr:hypothetical protein LTR37_020610 [Vermiconidia calcicola]